MGYREMNNRIKKAIGIILILMVVTGAFIVGRSTTNENKAVKNTNIEQIKNNTSEKIGVIRVLTQSTDDVYLEEGDIFTEFNNGSYIVENINTGLYLFNTPELGDYIVNNKEELNNIVETYKSIKEFGYY